MDKSSSLGFDKQIINCVRYNSDCSCLALATNKGYKIYTTQPLQLKQHRDFGAPIQLIQMVYRSNLIALVGYKQTPFAPPNKLVIFDDDSQKIIADVSFKSSIKCIVIRQKKIIVALYNKVFIIGLFTLEVEHIISTFKFQQQQKYNIISLSDDPSNLILAAPGVQNGQLLIVYLTRSTQRTIKAHQSILSAVQVAQDGQKVATTSQKGIQIRIFNTRTGQIIQQVRRGNQFATIYSLVFSCYGNWLAVSSDSHNVHIFAIKITEGEKLFQKYNYKQINNPKSLLYFIKGILPYFDAEYSYSNYKIDDFQTQMQSYLGFSAADDTLFIMNNFGTFEKLKASQKGGRCERVQRKNLIQG